MERSRGEPVVGSELAAFLHRGVAATVATRDDDLRPEIARAWGVLVAADGRSLTLCVAAAPGSKTRENLQANGAIAAGFSPPTVARGIQVKGSALAVLEPDADELDRAEQHLEAFVAEAEQIGVAPDVAGRIFDGGSLVSGTFSVDEVFDQTSGPSAGLRL